MSNINDANNNVKIFASGGLHARVLRDPSKALFIVKGVKIFTATGHLIQTNDEEIGNSSTIFQVPTGQAVSNSLWVMQLSGDDNNDRCSVGKFVGRKTPISELNINCYVSDERFSIEGQRAVDETLKMVVVMSRPEHAASTIEKYNISASGTVTVSMFGDWSFTWDNNETPADTDTASAADTFNSSSYEPIIP